MSGRRRRHSGGGRGGGRWAPFISPPPPSSPCVEAGRFRRSGVVVTPAAPALQLQRVRRERGAAQPPRGTAPTPEWRQPRSTGAAGRGSPGSRVTKGRVGGWLERGAGELARSHRCGLGRGGSGTLGLPTGYAGRRSRSGAGPQPARGLRWEEGRPGWGGWVGGCWSLTRPSLEKGFKTRCVQRPSLSPVVGHPRLSAGIGLFHA